MSVPPASARLWEVDLARTAAIAMMVIYHAAYDVHQLAPGLRVDPFSGGWHAHARRAAQVAAAALLVSAATWIAVGDDYVRFGILHCIAAAMLVAPLLVRLGWANAALGAAAVVAGVLLQSAPESDIPGLLLVGVPPVHGTVDWYPVLPWFGPVLIGLAVGLALYPQGARGAWGAGLYEPRGSIALGAPGRHALPIYLLHQPVLVVLVGAILALIGSR